MSIKESVDFPHKKSNNIVNLFVHSPIPDLRSPIPLPFPSFPLGDEGDACYHRDER